MMYQPENYESEHDFAKSNILEQRHDNSVKGVNYVATFTCKGLFGRC